MHVYSSERSKAYTNRTETAQRLILKGTLISLSIKFSLTNVRYMRYRMTLLVPATP